MKLMQKIDRSVFSYSHISFYPIPLYLLFLFSLLFLPGCEKQTTPVASPQIQLTVDEAAVTEAWLKLQVTNLESLEAVEITRNTGDKQGKDSTIYSGKPQTGDTTIYDHGLLPAHSYTYRVYFLFNGTRGSLRAKAELTTMDTTSHNFSWQIDTIGTYSSILYDVAIINETEIWAVGEIHTPETDKFDSLGNWVPPYNAVHWDGQEWILIRTEAPGYGFGTNFSVFAFNSNDIWVGSTLPEYWDGINWCFHGYNLAGGYYIRKIWGSSSNDIYFVGSNGNITRYNGQHWYRMYSGTDLDLRDISGNSSTVFITGHSEQQESISLNLKGGKWRTFIKSESYYGNPSTGDYGRMYSVYVSANTAYIVAKAGIIRYHLSRGDVDLIPDETALYHDRTIRKITGTADNDILLIDAWGGIIHYNGKDWFLDESNLNYFGAGNYFPRSGQLWNNLAVMVGYCAGSASAIIVRGNRSP